MWKNVVAPTLLVIVFWGLSSIATAYYTTYYINWLESLPKKMIQEDLSTIRAADKMRYTVGQLNRTMANASRPIDKPTETRVKQLETEFQKHLGEARNTAGSDAERVIDDEIGVRFKNLCDEIDRQIADRNTSPAATGDQIRQLMVYSSEVGKSEVILGDLNAKLMNDLATSRADAPTWLTVLRFGPLVIGPLAGILCGFWISRRFHRSISRISITLNDVATEMREHVGRVDVRQSGELPRLQEQVNAVVGRIREVIQQLNAARRQAITGARLAAVGEMAAGVAHELRNPLTSVKLLIQTGAQRPDRPLTDKQFRVVLEEISRMETTIERMLDFARPPRMNRGLHDVCEIVTRALSLFEDRTQHAAVEIVAAIPPVPVNVNADPEQLHQVFSNLLQNAIEAMPRGGVLRLTVDAGAGEKCRVTFADTGPGISSEVMQRIFEPFVTDKARGTGLGLAVSYRIVCDHDGKLTAENGPQGGAVFTVELPLFAAAAKITANVDAVPAADSPFRLVAPEDAHAQVAHH